MIEFCFTSACKTRRSAYKIVNSGLIRHSQSIDGKSALGNIHEIGYPTENVAFLILQQEDIVDAEDKADRQTVMQSVCMRAVNYFGSGSYTWIRCSHRKGRWLSCGDGFCGR